VRDRAEDVHFLRTHAESGRVRADRGKRAYRQWEGAGRQWGSARTRLKAGGEREMVTGEGTIRRQRAQGWRAMGEWQSAEQSWRWHRQSAA
jgi:hypothetical protein